jgi:hypothetical protein
MYWARSSSWA